MASVAADEGGKNGGDAGTRCAEQSKQPLWLACTRIWSEVETGPKKKPGYDPVRAWGH